MTLLPEAVPPRSLILEDVVWGIDPSTKRIALAIVGPNADGNGSVRSTHVLELRQTGGAQRLADAHEGMSAFFTEQSAPEAPKAVVVEQPFAGGRNVHPQSYFMVGVTLAALAGAIPTAEVELKDPGSWKRLAMGQGRGQAKKEEIMTWAWSIGYDGDDQDEADAVGIGTACAVLWAEGLDRR